MTNALRAYPDNCNVIDISDVMNKTPTAPSNYTSQGKRKATAGEPIRYHEDIIAIRDYLLSDDNKFLALRNNMLFTLGISIGIRGNDLLRLQIRDVADINGNVFKELSTFESKTSKMNHPVINDEAAKTIKEYLDYIGEYNMNDPLFHNANSLDPIGTSNLYKLMKKIEKKCNLKYGIGVRTLRKTFAYWTIKLHPNNINVLASLQEMLNHDSMNTTLHYSGHAKEGLRKMYEDISSVFDNSNSELDNHSSDTEGKPNNTIRQIYEIIMKNTTD